MANKYIEPSNGGLHTRPQLRLAGEIKSRDSP